jgi:hypothetical protein
VNLRPGIDRFGPVVRVGGAIVFRVPGERLLSIEFSGSGFRV